MSRIRELVRQFCRFSMFGLLCFGIDYGVLVLLTESGICSYIIASAMSYSVSVIVNYILSMKFVFNGREDMHKLVELMVFGVLSAIGLGLTQLLMWFTVEELGIFYMKAKILATMTVTVYNFFSRKLFLEQSEPVHKLRDAVHA